VRCTRDYADLIQAPRAAEIEELAHARYLSTARLEPVFRERIGSTCVDLIFEHAERVVVLPTISIDMVAVASLAGPALLWPTAFTIGEDAATEIEEKIYPWLRAQTRGRGTSSECIREYAPSDVFARARERGFRGAVRLSHSLVAAAPFVYARRFATNADVRIACDDAYWAAAILADRAASVAIDPAFAEDVLARRWYGAPAIPADARKPTLAIVNTLSDAAANGVERVIALQAGGDAYTVIVPEPTPCDHTYTFDPADSPEARRFAVYAAEQARGRARRADRIPGAFGGSGGVVALVLREDASYAPDSDSEAAFALERRLRAEGLDANVVFWSSSTTLAHADLIHVFGAVGETHVIAAMTMARELGLPYVVSLAPLAEPNALYEQNALTVALRLGLDETCREMYLSAQYRGTLLIDGLARFTADDIERQDRQFELLAVHATFLFLDPCEDSSAFLRRFPTLEGDRVGCAGAIVPDEPPEERVEAIVPNEAFAFVHAPFVLRSDLAATLTALSGHEVPLVVAGPIGDVEYAITLRRIAPRDTIILPDPTPGQVAGIYRHATLVIDTSRRPTGSTRLFRAALCGAVPLAPIASPLAALIHADDRLDFQAPDSFASCVRTALQRGDGPQRAQRIVEASGAVLDQAVHLRETLAAYARAVVPTA